LRDLLGEDEAAENKRYAEVVSKKAISERNRRM